MNLSLNNGYKTPTSLKDYIIHYINNSFNNLSMYTTKDNIKLRECIASINLVNSNNVFVSTGSGNCLNYCIPILIKQKYKKNLIKYGMAKTTKLYGLTTLKFTYSKIPLGCAKHGIPINYINNGPENDFNIKISTIRKYLNKYKSIMFYIVNPNNPDGKLKLSRNEIKILCDEYPNTYFVIDEAYIEFCENWENITVAPFVNQFKNLYVSRSMSFAYGIAGLRIGYWIGNSEMITLFNNNNIGYNIGMFQRDCAIHVLNNRNIHLKQMRKHIKTEINKFKNELKIFPINQWSGESNYILFRFNTPLIKGRDIKKYLENKGVLIKEFLNYNNFDFSSYFRISIGNSNENMKTINLIKQFFKETIQ